MMNYDNESVHFLELRGILGAFTVRRMVSRRLGKSQFMGMDGG